MMDPFKSNFKKFARLYPKEAILMEHLDQKGLEPIAPSVDLPEADDRIVYGAGNGEYYRALKGWIKEKRKRLLILIEPDLAVLKGLLLSDIGTEILKDRQVQLHYYDQERGGDYLLHRLMWQGFNRTSAMIQDPRYPEDPDFLFRYRYNKDHMKWFGEEFSKYSAGPYFNFYHNLKAIPGSYVGSKLFGKAEGFPAYIVGSGPSLNKNGEQLKKVGNAGLIFAAGGSSYAALEAIGLYPHFGAFIDPNAAQADRLKHCKNFNTPFFYRLRVNHQALAMITGPKLYLSGSGVYRTADWMGQKLGLDPVEIDEGHSVPTFATEIAVQMGCNPIIFVGMDLAFTGGEFHAKGGGIEPLREEVEETDIEGKLITTRWMWVKESGWFSSYAAAHPEITFINATEGGMGMKNIPSRPLQECLPQEEKEVPAELFHFAGTGVKLEQIGALLQELQQSLDRIDLLLEEMKTFYAGCDLKGFTGSFPQEAIWAMQLQEEPGFEAILSVFDEFFTQYLANSHLFYLIQRDGMNQEKAKRVVRGQRHRIEYLQNEIRLQKELMDVCFWR